MPKLASLSAEVKPIFAQDCGLVWCQWSALNAKLASLSAEVEPTDAQDCSLVWCQWSAFIMALTGYYSQGHYYQGPYS